MTDRRWPWIAAGAIALAAGASAWRAADRARDVPLSPVRGGRHIGPDWVERRGIGTGESPVGEMDDMGAYARDGFDPDRVHPEVRRFYERTSAYVMRAAVTWHHGFRLGAALAAPLTSRVEQLNLPGPYGGPLGRLDGRFVDVEVKSDPREDVRAWIRTDAETGEAVFVALYGSHAADDERFVNIAVPLPGSNLSTVLRMDHLENDGRAGDDRTGVELTTRGSGHPGLYLVTPAAPVELPMEQRFRVWPTDSGAEPDLRASHEMWLGAKFLTITYEISRRNGR